MTHVRNMTSFWIRDGFLDNQNCDKRGLTFPPQSGGKRGREMLILPPPGSPAATVDAEVWEGRRPRPASPTCCVAGCCHFRPDGKIQGEASPLPLSCLLIFFLKLERQSKTFMSIRSPCLCPLVEGRRRSGRALGGRDVHGARPSLLCLQAPSMEGRMEGGQVQQHWCLLLGSPTPRAILRPWRGWSHQAGKSRLIFVFPRGSGRCEQSVGAGPGCHVPPHHCPGAGMLPRSLSCPAEAVGRPEDGLFTLAETLEQPEGQISSFRLYILMTPLWFGAWRGEKWTSIKTCLFLTPHLVPAAFSWFPCRCLQTFPWLYYCLPWVALVTNSYLLKKKRLCTVFCCSYLLWSVFLVWETEQRWLQLFIAGEGVWIWVPPAWGGHGAACLRVARVCPAIRGDFFNLKFLI